MYQSDPAMTRLHRLRWHARRQAFDRALFTLGRAGRPYNSRLAGHGSFHCCLTQGPSLLFTSQNSSLRGLSTSTSPSIFSRQVKLASLSIDQTASLSDAQEPTVRHNMLHPKAAHTDSRAGRRMMLSNPSKRSPQAQTTTTGPPRTIKQSMSSASSGVEMSMIRKEMGSRSLLFSQPGRGQRFRNEIQAALC